ncbi:MAG: tRNA (adenosine(37)-N6)-threonylcarbamoyltransferase complex dimerization subunit type 1 TsaB [Aquificae bacterium]|nr:tRNA (adenosine(37)-N6)-threonylcarbamoyltransferase complex dimerization subunit type 1 TsaB [Aquificota bacterium]
MRLFALDASFSFINLAVLKDGELELLHYLKTEKKTLELLPSLLRELGLRPEDFDAYAVSVGAGYLTSLRISVTQVKLWAYTNKKPLVPFENLELMLRFTPVPLPRVAYLKVSRHYFYRTFDGKTLSPVKLYEGEKLEGYGITIKGHEGELTKELFVHPFFPFSAYGAVYADEFLKREPKGVDPLKVEPVYVKPPA